MPRRSNVVGVSPRAPRAMPNARARLAALAIGCAVTGLTAVLQAEDWPQWRGVNRDAVWRDTGIIERFPEGGPARHLAGADPGRVRRTGGGGRPGLRPRLSGDARQPDNGRPRAAAGARRGDRRRALAGGVARHLPEHPHKVRERTAHYADSTWRPRVHPGRGRDAVVLRRGDRRSDLAPQHRRRLQRNCSRLPASRRRRWSKAIC